MTKAECAGRRAFIIKVAVVLTAVAVAAGLYFINPVSSELTPKCPFKLITGLSCPACGIQRFLHALFNGRVAEAVGYNYYLVYALPYAVLFAVEWLLPHGAARDRLAAVIEHRYAVWFYVATFMIWFIVRNVLGI